MIIDEIELLSPRQTEQICKIQDQAEDRQTGEHRDTILCRGVAATDR